MKALRRAAVAVALVSSVYILNAILLSSKGSGIISEKDRDALEHLQRDFHKCVEKNGIGMYSRPKDDVCSVNFYFSETTKAKWTDPKTGQLEALDYDLDLCEALSTWEQVRNSSTVLTREFINGLPDGWHEYAWRRINKGIMLNNCADRKICEEKLSRVMPELPPFAPRQFRRCAVVGNSGDLLKAKFGKEIDTYDAVFRNNGAPTENYTDYVGAKRTFRLLNRGSAKALDKVAAMDDTRREVLIIKTTVHDTMNKMITEVPIPNPVYLLLGTSLGSSAKGTGVKGLELALSVCETVDVYGFTVDPGYTEWSRYFSEARGGHAPLLGRAYYQMMECLGLIKIHSPMRSQRGYPTTAIPGKRVIETARKASERVKGKAAAGRGDPLGSCTLWRRRTASQQQSATRLSKAAANHRAYVSGVTQYPLEHSPVNGMLCVRP